MDNAEWNYEISCIEVGKHKYYLPIFKNDSKNGVLSELFSERISFKKEINEAIRCKKDFCGNAVGFHYEDNTDSFNVYGTIEDANEDEHVYIKRPDLEEVIREIDKTVSKIDVFSRLIMELHPCVYDTFQCLGSADDYFNQGGLCGIVNKDDKWMFVGQEYPASGDNPNAWFNKSVYDSLDELIGDTIIILARKMFIVRKDN